MFKYMQQKADSKAKESNTTLSKAVFNIKKGSSQTGYLGFSLSSTQYAINLQNIITIIDNPALIFLSHMLPPVVGMQHYNNGFISVLDFAGYRPNNACPKILVLSENCFRKDNPFGLLVDSISDILYFKQKELILNKHPFDNLLPAYFYALHKNSLINLLDINDLAKQIE